MTECLPAHPEGHGSPDDDRVTYIEPCTCQECGGKCNDEYHYCRGKVYCTRCYQVEVAKCNATHATFTGEP